MKLRKDLINSKYADMGRLQKILDEKFSAEFETTEATKYEVKFIHEYFSARFDVHTTTKLNTVEMMEYIDKIQQLMIEQTGGEYEPLIPDEKE